MRVDIEKLAIMQARRKRGRKEIVDAGIASQTYNNIRNGLEVRPETLGKFAEALGCDITEII